MLDPVHSVAASAATTAVAYCCLYATPILLQLLVQLRLQAAVCVQASLTERALELLALPTDGVPRMLLDLGCGSGLSGEALSDNGHIWTVRRFCQLVLGLTGFRGSWRGLGPAPGFRSTACSSAKLFCRTTALCW